MLKFLSFYRATRSASASKSFWSKLIFFLDCIIFSLVVYYITYNIFIKISFWIDTSQYLDLATDVLCKAVAVGDNENKVQTIHSTTNTIIHNDSGWASSIRQIFIYGTGAFR